METIRTRIPFTCDYVCVTCDLHVFATYQIQILRYMNFINGWRRLYVRNYDPLAMSFTRTTAAVTVEQLKNARSLYVRTALRGLEVLRNYEHTHTQREREETWFLSGRQYWQGCWTHHWTAGNAGSLPHHPLSQYNHCLPHSQCGSFFEKTRRKQKHFKPVITCPQTILNHQLGFGGNNQ